MSGRPIRRFHAALWAVALATFGLPEGRAEDPSPAPTAPAEDLFAGLRSPLLSDREEAVRRIVSRLPEIRPAALEAFARGGPAERTLLAEVLARDGSPESVGTLVAALASADDVVGPRVVALLAENPEAARSALARWREDADPRLAAAPHLADLERLLLFAEVERRFAARKSPTGYTGYYRGQYAALEEEPYRGVAIDLCCRILEDRPLPAPGTHAAGRFEFLALPRGALEFDEAQSMAGHALIELAAGTPRAREVEARLRPILDRTRQQVEYLHATSGWRMGQGLRQRLTEKRALYAETLLVLYLVRPESFESEMEELLESLGSGSGLWADGWRPEAHAMVLLRIGRYPEAIQAYREVLDRRPLASQDDRNLAHAHYNLACAYASWSLGVEDSAEAADLRGEALRQLTLAVVRGRWSDLGWMEEDRDLDPIRDSPGYRALVEHIRRENTPPGGR
jgi:hypothetical protein